jgi:hypothetical protein
MKTYNGLEALWQVGAVDRGSHRLGQFRIYWLVVQRDGFRLVTGILQAQDDCVPESGNEMDHRRSEPELGGRFRVTATALATEGQRRYVFQPGVGVLAIDSQHLIALGDLRVSGGGIEHAPDDHTTVAGSAEQHAQCLGFTRLGVDQRDMLVLQSSQRTGERIGVGKGRRGVVS